MQRTATLTVCVKEARGLEASAGGRGKRDTYAAVHWGRFVARTEVMPGTLSPRWDAAFTFQVEEANLARTHARARAPTPAPERAARRRACVKRDSTRRPRAAHRAAAPTSQANDLKVQILDHAHEDFLGQVVVGSECARPPARHASWPQHSAPPAAWCLWAAPALGSSNARALAPLATHLPLPPPPQAAVQDVSRAEGGRSGGCVTRLLTLAGGPELRALPHPAPSSAAAFGATSPGILRGRVAEHWHALREWSHGVRIPGATAPAEHTRRTAAARATPVAPKLQASCACASAWHTWTGRCWRWRLTVRARRRKRCSSS